MSRKKMLESFEYLFSTISLYLVYRDGHWDLEQTGAISTLFKQLGEVECTKSECIGVYDLKMKTLDDVEGILLSAKEFWWGALKKDEYGNLLTKEEGQGVIILRNPFCGCNSIEEALIKADISSNSELLRFNFIYDPIPSTTFSSTWRMPNAEAPEPHISL